MRKKVGPDFQEPGRIPELVDLIEDQDRAITVPVEQFRVTDHVFDSREITVNVAGAVFSETQDECRFTDASDSGQPDDRGLLPGFLEAGKPKGPVYHVTNIVI